MSSMHVQLLKLNYYYPPRYAELTADHAGFLLALGLSGHLSTLPKLQLHDYLVKGYELTTVALLLGVAAAQ